MQPSSVSLLTPRRRNIPHPRGDDDPVEGGALRDPLGGVGVHHVDVGVAGVGENPTRPGHDVRVDVDGGDLPAGADELAINAALQPPEPISKHRIPGVRCACSSMIACTYGADTRRWSS